MTNRWPTATPTLVERVSRKESSCSSYGSRCDGSTTWIPPQGLARDTRDGLAVLQNGSVAMVAAATRTLFAQSGTGRVASRLQV